MTIYQCIAICGIELLAILIAYIRGRYVGVNIGMKVVLDNLSKQMQAKAQSASTEDIASITAQNMPLQGAMMQQRGNSNEDPN